MKEKNKIYLSVIIPCYNEAENIKRGVLGEVKKYMDKVDYSWEVIISDDGSTDESRKLVKSKISRWKNFRLKSNDHGGKPHALMEGIKEAKGKYVLFSDMDQSTPIEELDKLTKHLNGKYAAVIGSRGVVRKNFPFYRKLGSFVFMSVRKLFVLPDINDTQCGFKLFRRSVVMKAFPKLEFFKKEIKASGWKVTSYDVELLHIIEKMGKKIKEVKVKWEDADVSTNKGGGIGRYFNESNEMLSQILRVKVNDMRGLYD